MRLREGNTAQELRDEAVNTRRLARFYDRAGKATGSAHLTRAAALCYQRADKLETEARQP